MTNEELFQDLKQFITATVSRQATDLGQRIEVVEKAMATKEDIAGIEQRLTAHIDQVQDATAETLTDVTGALGTTKHEVRDLERRVFGKHRKS